MHRALILPSLTALALSLAPPAAQAGVLLDVGFEGMVTGAPLPVGGAVALAPGEKRPGAITTAIERHDGSNWLAIGDDDDYAAGVVRFEPPGVAEPTRGEVAISCDLYFDALEEGAAFFIAVRERGSSAQSFLDISFSDEGDVRVSSADPSSRRYLGSYTAMIGRPLPLDMVFNLDAGTYDLWLDGDLMVEGAPHGVRGRGVGAVLFGTQHDPDYVGVFYIDNVRMTHER